ncbi:MAG TPA: MlaD family protein [Fimbriimonadaceae bacterium]|nr:MlaD family protein [Fimbriimonadaceae bacterium]
MQGSAKVGFLVVVFVLLLYGAYAVLGKTLFSGQQEATYYAEFADAGGAVNGTSISMAGVHIGTVRKVELVSASLARLTLEIDRAVKIPNGSQARMGGSLIGIGSSPMTIVPPKVAQLGYIPPGGTIQGVKASAIESFLPEEGKQTLKELNLTLEATRRLLENQTLEKKLENLIDNSSKTLGKFGDLATQAQGLVAKTSGVVGQGRPEIVAAMHSASLAMADIHKATQLLTQLIQSGKYQDQTMALLKQLNDTAAKANDLMTNLNEFASDPKMQADIKQSVANVDKMTDSGTRIAANTEAISKNGVTLSQKAIELADKANSIADDAKTALDKISTFFNKNGGAPKLPHVEGHLDLLRQTDPTHWRTDLYGRFDLDRGFLDAGLYDAFETNKVILQLGEPIGSSADYRYGIYASKPAVGVDFRVAPTVKLRSDLFDINKPQFDLRAEFDFGNGFVGWLGVEKVFSRDSFVAGIGVKR